MAPKGKQQSGSGKGKVKTRAKDVQVKHAGFKVRFINLSERDNFCACDRKLGKDSMVVAYENNLYCSWKCSDRAAA
jgi:hypothetical protein